MGEISLKDYQKLRACLPWEELHVSNSMNDHYGEALSEDQIENKVGTSYDLNSLYRRLKKHEADLKVCLEIVEKLLGPFKE